MAYLADSDIGSDYLSQIAASQSQSLLSVLKTDIDRDYFEGRMSPEDYQFALNAYNKRWSDLASAGAVVQQGLTGGGIPNPLMTGSGNTQDDVTGLVGAALAGQGNQQTGATNMPTWPTGEFESSFPQAAWQRSYGLPGYGMNPYQQWMAGQAAPAYASWLGSQLLPGAGPTDFNPQAGFGGQAGYTALRQARGLGAPEQVQWQSELGGDDALANLLQSALGKGGRGYASPIANIMAGRVKGLQSQWRADTQAGAQGISFLEYLMQKYGL